MKNPFEDDTHEFVALVNDQGQHSLWPAHFSIPAGWELAFGPESRALCIDYVNTTWTELRPTKIERAQSADAAIEATIDVLGSEVLQH
ncbi:MbtH family NRPS accessory protein [Agrobacterium vitis]|uniref:MbtH family NRPS accessory protein n=1 Tax=Agrobacterium vitis TaxID=373 RepID=A0A6L6VI33_AGRVI|nr:MbtH family protein [Agrobacterium vitis]MUZ75256.1 MbtH family NRPS accessory protein [Agrobacterium vitis]